MNGNLNQASIIEKEKFQMRLHKLSGKKTCSVADMLCQELKFIVTKCCVTGCMVDLNGVRPGEQHRLRDDDAAWQFYGSSITQEADSDVEENGAGFDMFDDVPSDSDVTYEADDVLFDFTDRMLPPTLHLCVDKDKG